jgi:hypothetical protein
MPKMSEKSTNPGYREQSSQSVAALAKEKVKSHVKAMLKKLRTRDPSAATKSNPDC